MKDKEDRCELCGSKCNLSRHHLVPKLKAKNKYKKEKDNPSNIILVCRSCNDQIHALFTEVQLRDLYSTKEALLHAPGLDKFIAWKKRHPEFDGHAKMSNCRKRS